MTEMIFFLLLLCFLHTWIIYPGFMAVVVAVFGAVTRDSEQEKCVAEVHPKVSIILPVYNEGYRVVTAVEKLLALDYPSDSFEIIVVSDGSKDDTSELMQPLVGDRVSFYELDTNMGKSSAQNLGVKKAKHPVLFFVDSGAALPPDCLMKAVRVLSGERYGIAGLKIIYRKSQWERAGSQSIYWRAELTMRKGEFLLGHLFATTGSAFLIKIDCFRDLDPDTGDDLLLPLDVILQGKKVAYVDDTAVEDEWPASGVLSELRVRRRMAMRNLIGLARRKAIFNPIKYPMYAFCIFSHKVLRWLSPFLLIGIFLTCWSLSERGGFFTVAFALMEIGLIAAVVGVLATIAGKRLPVAGVLGSFALTNVGLLWGVLDAIRGKKIFSYKN